MGVPSKKVTSSNLFFTEKIRLEQAVIDFEKIIVEGSEFLDTIEDSLKQMNLLAEQNNSAYFLQRVKKLQVLYHTLKIKKGYVKEEFDGIYHILEKIKSEDRIEFLDSALKNRITKVAKNLTGTNLTKQKIDLDGKEIFTSFKTGGIYFLIPKRPYRILKNIPAYKSMLTLKGKSIPLFPGPGFPLKEDDDPIRKNILLIKSSGVKEEGFYFDELLEDWAISKDSINHMLLAENKNTKILGKIRRKGINYHLIKLL
ncbi:MAG: hypothetical protein SH817_18930 [Leptospira sp.]|nr:hypothetical protein [Leptospira sp.]